MSVRLVYKTTAATTPSPGVSSGPIDKITEYSTGRISVQFPLEAGSSVSPDIQEGDVVLLFAANLFIYGVFERWDYAPQDFSAFIMTYDTVVYNVDLDVLNNFVIYESGAGLYASNTTAVDTYKFSISVSNALYSSRLITYNSTNEYSILIDDKKRRMVGEMWPIISSSELFLVDTCGLNQIAYKIALSEDSFDTYNNKFKKTIQFKVAAP